MKKEYPTVKGFNKRGIYRMKQFYETYKDYSFVSPLVTQISWTNNENPSVGVIIMSKFGIPRKLDFPVFLEFFYTLFLSNLS